MKILFLLLLALPCFADEDRPHQLLDIGVTEHLGEQIDLNLEFTNESNQKVKLQEFFDGKRPVVFFLVYYGCPSLCTLVLNSALEAMKDMPLTLGKDYRAVAVSIDPSETSDLAKDKRDTFVSEYKRGTDWNFLVGKKENIDALAGQIGFRFKWDPDTQQFAHGSNFFVMTPQGKISRYFYGLVYSPQDLRLALVEASQGRTGSFIDKILLFCYHYDASNRKYVLLANRIMMAGGILTFGILLSILVFVRRRIST